MNHNTANYVKQYQQYLKSPQWRFAREKASRKHKKRCKICYTENGIEWHHYMGYEAIWTEEDYRYIVPLCHYHHRHAHYGLLGKRLELSKKALKGHYRMMKIFPWLYLRPSDFLDPLFYYLFPIR